MQQITDTTNKYYCKICKYGCSQKSHFDKHSSSEKHILKTELFKLELEKLSPDELNEQYKTNTIDDLIKYMEGKHRSYDINLDFEEITNTNILRQKIHEIHNYLRNHGAGYGMSALKVFNVLYELHKIEESNLVEKTGLDTQYKFSELFTLVNDDTRLEEINDIIFMKIMPSLHKNKILKNILYYRIPPEIKNGTFKYLINRIDEIKNIEKSCGISLSGKTYEYFIGRDETAISELGAYFTNRHIVNYIYDNLLELTELNEGTVPTMIDPFGGSGGFTTGYIMYLNRTFNETIDWKTQFKKINHYDINQDVIKSAALEFLCLTGELPVLDNFKYKDAFRDTFEHKYKYIITNPPYGGDKVKKTNSTLERDKIIEFINSKISKGDDVSDMLLIQLANLKKQNKKEKLILEQQKVTVDTSSKAIQLYAKKHNLSGKDKESVSLILMMDLLETDGRAIGVLKEGVFFNGKYKALRKCLIENFNVSKIISVSSNEFENTTTKTSIIVFDNTEEKTSVIKFYDLIIEKHQDDVFEIIDGLVKITKHKDQIISVTDTLVSTATRDELLDNDTFSFNATDYIKQSIIPGDNYKLVKLGNICESMNGYAFKTPQMIDIGIPLIKIKDIYDNKINTTNILSYINGNKKYEKYVINKNDLIITLTGKKPKLCEIAFKNDNVKMYLNQRLGKMYNFKIDRYVIFGLFHSYIIPYINLYLGNGTNQDNISLKTITNIEIPIPKDNNLMVKWSNKISQPYDNKIDLELKLKNLEQEVKDTIKSIYDNADCDEVKLGNVCEIKYGTRITKKKDKVIDDYQGKKYPVYGGGDITFYTNKKNREGFNIIVSRFALSNNCVRLINKSIFLNDSGLSLKIDNIILKKYIGYILINKQDIIKKSTNGSIQTNLNIKLFKKIKLKIPKDKTLIKNLEPKFELIEQYQTDIKKSDVLFNQYIEELRNEAIKQM